MDGVGGFPSGVVLCPHDCIVVWWFIPPLIAVTGVFGFTFSFCGGVSLEYLLLDFTATFNEVEGES